MFLLIFCIPEKRRCMIPPLLPLPSWWSTVVVLVGDDDERWFGSSHDDDCFFLGWAVAGCINLALYNRRGDTLLNSCCGCTTTAWSAIIISSDDEAETDGGCSRASSSLEMPSGCRVWSSSRLPLLVLTAAAVAATWSSLLLVVTTCSSDEPAELILDEEKDELDRVMTDGPCFNSRSADATKSIWAGDTVGGLLSCCCCSLEMESIFFCLECAQLTLSTFGGMFRMIALRSWWYLSQFHS